MQLRGDLQQVTLHSWQAELCAQDGHCCPACRVFERRLWCRFLCPIGGMNGMFAKLAMTEVRASRGVCAGACLVLLCARPWSCQSWIQGGGEQLEP